MKKKKLGPDSVCGCKILISLPQVVQLRSWLGLTKTESWQTCEHESTNESPEELRLKYAPRDRPDMAQIIPQLVQHPAALGGSTLKSPVQIAISLTLEHKSETPNRRLITPTDWSPIINREVVETFTELYHDRQSLYIMNWSFCWSPIINNESRTACWIVSSETPDTRPSGAKSCAWRRRRVDNRSEAGDQMVQRPNSGGFKLRATARCQVAGLAASFQPVWVHKNMHGEW